MAIEALHHPKMSVPREGSKASQDLATAYDDEKAAGGPGAALEAASSQDGTASLEDPDAGRSDEERAAIVRCLSRL